MSKCRILINHVTGEECRVAIVHDGKLQELHAERFGSADRVGNIYVGKVANVEAGIQAAFIDFGVEQAGFLHVSDLHPRYFPGQTDQTTESIGQKIPRRERPPLQQCLKRGQEVIVQVIKDGVGTKGPTLTSYLSIPGRYLVMMPQMDRIGVSRRVEDDDLRKQMRTILDQLDLPEGFGFILRTAGMDRTKGELTRDLAYLKRLWKDMERRRSHGKKPALLYSESDLLIRVLRDLLTTQIDEVVIDDPRALERAGDFLKLVAPRSGPKLMRYMGTKPLFHAFGVEQQIATIHDRDVPLPSGGRLVIDETEALVAFDVNSGRMRGTRDAETTAFRTNLEAADEICRQLRLRDLGGLVVLDLIDMRDSSHRRQIEARFRERLKLDRARSSILPISQFGIMEMTRQRMRASKESLHFTECPTCRGRGLVRRAGSIVADALRDLAVLLDHDKIHRVEMVVGPRVAGELLSNRRQGLGRLEANSGKHVDVRVSETMPIDRVSLYAYDEAGADIDVDSLRMSKADARIEPWSPTGQTNWAQDEPEPDEHAGPEADQDQPAPKKRRRRRRRGKSAAGDAQGQDSPEVRDEATPEPRDTTTPKPVQAPPTDQPSQESSEPEAGTKKRRRRRRRGRGAGASAPESQPAEAGADPAPESAPDPPGDGSADDARAQDTANDSAQETAADEAPSGPIKKKRRRRRRRGSGSPEADNAQPAQEPPAPPSHPEAEPAAPVRDAEASADGSPAPAPKKRRRRRGRSSSSAASSSESGDRSGGVSEPAGTSGSSPSPSTRKPDAEPPRAVVAAPRALYASRRRLSPAQRDQTAGGEG